MDKVLNITGRIEDKKRQEQIATHRSKFDAVQRLLQCGSCRFKCAMCGRHAEETESSASGEPSHREFVLCESCGAEFEDYKKISEQKGEAGEIFWHNNEWLEMWSCWVAYQRSLDNFRKSFRMKQLPGKE